MAWIIKGSFALDRMFGCSFAADIDVFWEALCPDENTVRRVACLPEHLQIDFEKEGFSERFNIDQIHISDDGDLVSPIDDTPECLVVEPLSDINTDDCMRILKTAYKYRSYLVLSMNLVAQIKGEMSRNVEEDYFDAVYARLTQYMTQPDVYMAIRNFLTDECNLQLDEDDCPSIEGYADARIPCERSTT